MSTSTPWLARDIHAAFKQAGLDALDAPLSNGGVFISVGGDEAAYERMLKIKNSPHPNAGAVFMNWFLSKDAQDIYERA